MVLLRGAVPCAQLEKVAEEYKDKVKIFKIDTDVEADLATSLQVFFFLLVLSAQQVRSSLRRQPAGACLPRVRMHLLWPAQPCTRHGARQRTPSARSAQGALPSQSLLALALALALREEERRVACARGAQRGAAFTPVLVSGFCDANVIVHQGWQDPATRGRRHARTQDQGPHRAHIL